MVIHNLGQAGMEVQLRHLATALVRQGHEVTIACVNEVHTDFAPFRDEGIRAFELRADDLASRLRALPTLVRLARRHDVVHCTGWDSSLWGRLAAAAARRPVVVTEHSLDRRLQTNGSASRMRLIAAHHRLLQPVTYATIACATGQIDLLLREGVDSRRLVHVPNGVPIADIEHSARTGPTREDFGIPAGALVVAHVARFHPLKNQRATLDAVARLREELGDVRALLVGKGDQLEEMRRYAAEIDADWATFTGRRSDVGAMFALADLAVLPSFAEAMPLTMIEAMAVGVPLVATDVGDVPGVLRATAAGVCVPRGDPDAFYEACRGLLLDAELRRSMGANALRARWSFDAHVMAERYSLLFEGAIEARAVRAVLGNPAWNGTSGGAMEATG